MADRAASLSLGISPRASVTWALRGRENKTGTKDAHCPLGGIMSLSNLVSSAKGHPMADQGKGLQEKKPHKRFSKKEERVKELLKRLDVKMIGADRGFI